MCAWTESVPQVLCAERLPSHRQETNIKISRNAFISVPLFRSKTATKLSGLHCPVQRCPEEAMWMTSAGQKYGYNVLCMQNVCMHSVYWTCETRGHHRFPRALCLGEHCPAVRTACCRARLHHGDGANPAQHRTQWHPVYPTRAAHGHGKDLVVPAAEQPRVLRHDRAQGR